MNYRSDEQSTETASEASGRGVEPADLATELRCMWHSLVSGADIPGRLGGLQRQQIWVLAALADGPRRMSDLAGTAFTTQASLTGIVDRLEEHGLVERRRSAEDRRVVEVALTDEGLTQMRAKQARMVERLDEVFAPLSDDERAEFLRLVRVINRHAGGCSKA